MNYESAIIDTIISYGELKHILRYISISKRIYDAILVRLSIIFGKQSHTILYYHDDIIEHIFEHRFRYTIHILYDSISNYQTISGIHMCSHFGCTELDIVRIIQDKYRFQYKLRYRCQNHKYCTTGGKNKIYDLKFKSKNGIFLYKKSKFNN